MEKVLATISDVARLSGMSVSTVSRVINNKPHVSEEKRQKILEAMDALGYSPLQAPRQLRGSGSGNIAVVVPTITNNFFAQLVDSIEKTCRQYHYRTLIVQTYGEKESEESAMNLLKMQHADGVILCAIENDWDKLKSYGEYGKLVVAMNIIRTRKFRWYAADSMKGFIKLRNIFWKKDIERLHIVQEQEQ